jgi:hypothetical protein
MSQPNEPARITPATDNAGNLVNPADSTTWNGPVPKADVALLSEGRAKWFGYVLTGIVGGTLIYVGTKQILAAIGHLTWFLIAAWTVAVAIQFWTASSWRDGLSTKELLLAFFWPYDVIRSIKLGLQATKGKVINRTRDDQTGPKVLSQTGAIAFGVGVSALAVLLLIPGLMHALAAFSALMWSLAIIWILGAIVQFWVSEAWTDGLTRNEIIAAFLWPYPMFRIVRAGVNTFMNS